MQLLYQLFHHQQHRKEAGNCSLQSEVRFNMVWDAATLLSSTSSSSQLWFKGRWVKDPMRDVATCTVLVVTTCNSTAGMRMISEEEAPVQ